MITLLKNGNHHDWIDLSQFKELVRARQKKDKSEMHFARSVGILTAEDRDSRERVMGLGSYF
jgi:hypothetical protein